MEKFSKVSTYLWTKQRVHEYVGQTSNLRKRIKEHFQGTTNRKKKDCLLKRI
ncbi:GIY-YIG nuclease family protein [Psychrobacillus sp. L3]|uniref:GIY-YIG nuclease family protein n=1 Tax=Psychrobacillus sp. L3 TaxID=3236891 RepID=UPI0036F41A9E